MKYDLKSSREAGDAIKHLNRLIADEKKVEIKVIKPRRSLNQNAYLHLLLGAFGVNFGYTLEEAKTIYKMLPGNKDIYLYEKEVRGKTFEFVRSSSELNVDEMTKTIDTLRTWSAKAGFPLPTATDQDWLRSIENQMEQQEKYL